MHRAGNVFILVLVETIYLARFYAYRIKGIVIYLAVQLVTMSQYSVLFLFFLLVVPASG